MVSREEAKQIIAEKFGVEEEDKEDIENFLIITYNKKGEITDKKVNIDSVAEYIENKFDIRTIFGLKEETLEVYEEGIWKVTGKGIIKAEIERLLGSWARNNVVAEILEKIKRRTEVSREETEEIPYFKRCLNNGVLDFENINDIKLLPHDKKYNFRTKWNIDYNPEAKCELYLSVINSALYEQDLLKFQEWNALHLPRKYLFKKWAIYHGPKDTSKTLMMNHLTLALNNNVSGLTLQDIARGKPFDLLVLMDKDANICDELSSSDMKTVGGVKKSVGDGFIDGEMKFGDKIRFPNTAKQTYACNKIPNSGDDIDDEAHYGRIILFSFDNVIPEDKQDKELINKITTPKELSGWLNWVIEGYKRLIQQNKFSNDLTPAETKYLMIQNGNSLAEFATEVLVHADGEKVDKETMYQIYCKWCMDHKPQLSPDSKDKIGKTLTRFAPYTQASSNGKERYWLNVKINDSYYMFSKNMSIYGESKNDAKNNIYNFSEPVIPVIKIQKELDSYDISNKKEDEEFNKLKAQYEAEGLL